MVSASQAESVIIVGSGKMGLLHGALITSSDAHSVVALVDASWKSRRIAKASGIEAPSFPSLAAALRAQPEASACLICTPPSSHAPIALEALAAGLNVFVEKPLATSAAASDSVVNAAEDAGLRGAVGYVRRFSPTLSRLRDELTKRAETPATIEVAVLSPQFVGMEGGGAARGGIEWDLLPHATDAALWLAGGRAGQVDRATRRGLEAIAVHGRDGKTGVRISADWACRAVRKVEQHVRVTFEDGTVLGCDDDRVWMETMAGRRSLFHRREAPPPRFDVAGAEFTLQMDEVLRYFGVGGETTCATLADGAEVDAWIAQGLAASAGGIL